MNYFKPEPSFGGATGAAIGQGLANLLQNKMAQVQKQNVKTQTFQALKALGAPAEEAAAMSNLPESLQTKMFPNYVNALLEQRRSNPQQAQQAEQQPQQQTQQQPQQQQNGLAALQGLSAAAPSQEAAIGQPQADIAKAPNLKFPTAQENAQNFTKQLGVGQGQAALNTMMQQPQQQAQKAEAPQNVSPMQQATQQITSDLNKPGQRPRDWKPYTFKEKAALRKEHKDFTDEIFHKKEGAHTTKMTVGRMQTLNREGKLIDPTAYNVLKKNGWDIPGLMTADTNEFIKLQQVFLQHMKDIFGSRISISEMEQFIQGIPSLMQTPEGRERVFRNFSIMADIDEEKARVLENIEDQYGYQPENLKSIVDRRMDPYYDQKTKEFVEGAERPKFKPGDKIDITKIPAFTVPHMRAKQDGKTWESDGAQWIERK
jgi:hypothetical protein